MRRLLVLVILAVTLPLHAGTVYHYVLETPNDPLNPPRTGARVFVDGDRYRVELDPSTAVRAFDVAISQDGDRSAILVNLHNRTWYNRDEEGAGTATSSRFLSAAARAGTLKFATNDETSGEQILGHTTQKHVIRFSYDAAPIEAPGGDTYPGPHLGATILVWTTTDLPPVASQQPLITNFPELNARLVATYASFGGMILKEVLTSTRTYDGGRPSVDVRTMTVDQISSATVPPTEFELPKGLAHQIPQVSGFAKVRH